MRFFDGVADENPTDVFTFTARSKPVRPLSFTRSSQPCPEQPDLARDMTKRPRALADVDGEACANTSHKKRRLRLLLITSRLSRPFSAPPTHIVNRGVSKIALWAKQKALGRNLLRKAAMLNSFRMKIEAAREVERKKLELARQAFMQVTHRRQAMAAQIPRRQYIPLPPSPLGLTNYDAFDVDDEVQDDMDEDDEDREGSLIYSDFNIIDPSESVIDDYDSLDDFDMLPHDHGPSAREERNVPEMAKGGEFSEVSSVLVGTV
ncbi:MAG: hypothetical protein M4579_002663 [Chaenotheca gracillima]|nr:MAG: hypothetical protein M4579_002663 [Chaenotheca gracillima]